MSHELSRETIRIGTLVEGGPGTANYIRQILPHGFESFSIYFWQTLGETDVKTLAAEVKETLAGTGVVISSLAIFGNPLEDEPKDKLTLAGWKILIDNAHLFGCDLVCGFTGRVRGKPIEKSLPAFKKVFGPLARRAADRGLRLAFENCDMSGTWQTGDWNIAHTPQAWELMFNELPMDNLGLEWEPCHQMIKLLAPMPQLCKWVPKIFHVHGKDATIQWNVIREYGVHGGKPFALHRTPGFGDSNWTDIISLLRFNGFKGSIDIEGWHDPVYRKELEMTGQVHALRHLIQCRGGHFIPNPV